MFSPKAVGILGIVAIICSAIGLLLSIAGMLLVKESTFAFIIGCVSWLILGWASIIGFQLSRYKLYEEEYKKVGIRLILIIVAFVIFFFIGIVGGIIISIGLLSTLWSLKRNYDEWNSNEGPSLDIEQPEAETGTSNN